MNMRDFINEHAEGAILFDGCDSALIGYGSRIDMEPVAIYSSSKGWTRTTLPSMSSTTSSDYGPVNVPRSSCTSRETDLPLPPMQAHVHRLRKAE
jgi:hypothetical protein